MALKLIKAGMDTGEVVLRFETERQALALMDHPAIAKVFDAGPTSQGRPFFVMEFVLGSPITAYCDEKKLTVRERAKLFIRVCEAVQHAHQKAILHRDLKPSNILVTEVDGRALPKIIDFGVARATGQCLTSETFFTHSGTLNAMVALANALDDEGRFAEAEKINRRAMETELRVLGPEHYKSFERLETQISNLSLTIHGTHRCFLSLVSKDLCTRAAEPLLRRVSLIG